ncbi:uncharacterized protein DUF3563 [Roseiarcus fermentans]|uniref:Uncharacterized protein DUF3563 n=1 Tax=Roseiarcus fermentans TaxID=1473586 RepID=A0A366FR91_9HYPH|nr:DUF3563 family protein [Roseiarcus fermentans]RBP16570.1 uncharacterized protein DUF3563 [Roseiarcus fermentans]
MRSIQDLTTALRQIFKYLSVPSDDERAAAYLEQAGDLIDLEMRVREIDRGRMRGAS